MTGYNYFHLDQALVFLCQVFALFFRTLLLSVAALILTSNFSWLAEVGNFWSLQCVIWANSGGGLCSMDQCCKWQYSNKVLGKCFIGYIYRNIVQYCTWYNHSIRIRCNTCRHMAHAFWVQVSFPEVQSLVEAGRMGVQIAWPLWVRRARLLSALLKRTARITQAGAGSQTLRSGTVDFNLCVAPLKSRTYLHQ